MVASFDTRPPAGPMAFAPSEARCWDCRHDQARHVKLGTHTLLLLNLNGGGVWSPREDSFAATARRDHCLECIETGGRCA